MRVPHEKKKMKDRLDGKNDIQNDIQNDGETPGGYKCVMHHELASPCIVN